MRIRLIYIGVFALLHRMQNKDWVDYSIFAVMGLFLIVDFVKWILYEWPKRNDRRLGHPKQ